ncbi:ABC transporter permease [Novibacillus thermophilus]|uniref:Peptide ABC transporter permease n=1 Tax=Novibacillus thermophilus TaxID=1471761 RepID=A0A1U9K8X5_9BACL|nr:ABC transporter permease [Novibacillus thermophilus]AQS56443.1 peptide ABC transporter permease [Novibacillus thermophilus]
MTQESTMSVSNEMVMKRTTLVKWDWGIIIACIPVTMYVLIGIFGPIFIDFDPTKTFTGSRLLPPGSVLENGKTAWLGTDQVGRDILSQIIYGTRISLLVSLATVLIGGSVGVLLGLISGYFGGLVDSIIMRIADIQLAFPAILLAILIAGVLGPSITNVIITLSITRWVTFARVTRGATMATKKREFVDSARVLGVSNLKILFKHVFPMCVSPLMVIITVQIGLVIISEASLSFLGLGVPPSQPSWGLLISHGRDYINSAWWIATMPGIALAILVVSVGFLGDKLRDKFDPSLD